jgi:transcription elongation factor Elf1
MGHDPNVQIQPEGWCEGAKRQYMPFAITWTCPGCGHACETDEDWYLAYPKLGGVNEVTLWCPECDHEHKVSIQLNVSAVLVHGGVHGKGIETVSKLRE